MELVLKAISMGRGVGEGSQSDVASLRFGDLVRLIDDNRPGPPGSSSR